MRIEKQVDRNDYRPGLLDAEVDGDECRAVQAVETDVIARLHAALNQAGCNGVGLCVELGIGDRVIRGDNCRFVCMQLNRRAKMFGK